MSGVSESILLCEGFDDRSFWQGLLLSVGCKEDRKASSPHTYNAVYRYRTPGGGLLQVVPCGAQTSMPKGAGDDPVRYYARLLLRARATKPLARLVLNLDVDLGSPSDVIESIRSLVGKEAKETPSGEFEFDGGQTVVSPILWYVPDPVADGVPSQQALERLVCAALSAAFPERGRKVKEWLASRPHPRGKEHKAHAWSFMAGWHTDHGMGDFYASLWRDPAIEKELRSILKSTGTWAVLERLLGLPPVPPTAFEVVMNDDSLD
ncbi:hypothetical protein [Polyangium sp. 6x1]|uniref:hypothetical protein n=1 Tax=Polyangium sp. 6x1 TaxID=3042689 RepID=UPI0024830B8E|nr:hypothetical protein [Polyangium sp. 6x1]MDI1452146.1 hypothetical protein [Polyangium sp. 6x1]